MSTCDKLTGTLTLGATMSGGLLVAKGDKGDKGDAYVITESDKQEIKEALSGDISELKGDLAGKLPKSPVDWEPWTADEQAVARERIGEPKYEFIEEITLDGTEAQLIRDYTDNPCKKIMLKTETPAIALSMSVRYSLNGTYIIDSSKIGDSSYSYKHIARFELSNGLLTTLLLGNRGSDANRFNPETSIRGLCYFLDRIDKIQLNITNPAAGAKIYIYGVRA